jgi:uncharacterized protein HemX
VTVAIAWSRYHDVDSLCTDESCSTQAAVNQRTSARKLGDVATGLGIAGALGAGAGAILWWLESRDGQAQSAAARRGWDVAVRAEGFTIRGPW